LGVSSGKFSYCRPGIPFGEFPFETGSLEELDVVGGGVEEGGRLDNATVESPCCEGARVLGGRDRQLQVVSTSSDATSFGI